MPTAPGFANCSYELRRSDMSRSAFLTFGCDPTSTDPSAIATSLMSSFAAVGSLFSVIDSGVTMIKTRVALGTDGTADLVGENTTPVACTKALTSGPPNVAVLVHKRTLRGGRRGRGRFYIPWAYGTTVSIENGTLLASDRTNVQAALDAWKADVLTRVGPLVVLHRPSKPGTAFPTPPGEPNEIVSFYVDPLCGTQRRRVGR